MLQITRSMDTIITVTAKPMIMSSTGLAFSFQQYLSFSLIIEIEKAAANVEIKF